MDADKAPQERQERPDLKKKRDRDAEYRNRQLDNDRTRQPQPQPDRRSPGGYVTR